MYQWCGFKSRRGKNKNLTALKSNSNTVWFNFQTYIYISIQYYSNNNLHVDNNTGSRGTELPPHPPHPPFFNFLFTYLFSIKFLYFFIISSLVPYFDLFVPIFIQSSGFFLDINNYSLNQCYKGYRVRVFKSIQSKYIS